MYPRMSLLEIAKAVEAFFEILEIKRSVFGEKNSFLAWTGIFKKRKYFYSK